MDLATFDPANAADSEIRQAQELLGVDADGIFGPKSRAALASYRQAHPTPATPVAGLTHLQQLILDCLAQYVGLVEIVDNAKWDDPHNPGRAAVAEKYRRGLIALGCEPGWAYCITSARLVWREAYADAGRAADFAALDRHMSVSVMGSFNALHEAGLTRQQPIVGAILFMEHGHTGEGHAVVVTEVHADTSSAPGPTRAPPPTTRRTSARATASTRARSTRWISHRSRVACGRVGS